MTGLVFEVESPPMILDSTGAVRVGGSRVLLELVIEAFQDGATAENIVQRYPTVHLSDVYGVIAYYLRHPQPIEAYLADRDQKAGQVRSRIEARQGDLSAIRTRLLSQKR